METKKILRVTFDLDVTRYVQGDKDDLAFATQYAFDLVFQNALTQIHWFLIESHNTPSSNEVVDSAYRDNLVQLVRAIEFAKNSAKYELI